MFFASFMLPLQLSCVQLASPLQLNRIQLVFVQLFLICCVSLGGMFNLALPPPLGRVQPPPPLQLSCVQLAFLVVWLQGLSIAFASVSMDLRPLLSTAT